MKQQRNITIDIIRGFLLIIMTIDHFSHQVISFYIGYFSAAEGFVFISGIVMGIYGISKYNSEGYLKLKSRLINRSLRIYKYHLLTVLFYFLFKAILNSSDTFFTLSTLKAFNYKYFLWSSFLIFKPYGLDILPMYILFVSISPFVIKLITKNKIKLVLIFSIILWVLNLLFFDSFFTLWCSNLHIPLTGAFSVLSWQLIFILGILIGYLVNSNYLNKYLDRKISIVISTSIFILFFSLKVGWIEAIDNNLISSLIARSALHPLILLNFFAVSHMVYYIIKNIRVGINFNSVSLLGQYSIQVFTFHLLLFIIFRNYLPIFSIEFINSANYFHSILNNILNWTLTVPLAALLFIPPIFLKIKTPLLKIFPKVNSNTN